MKRLYTPLLMFILIFSYCNASAKSFDINTSEHDISVPFHLEINAGNVPYDWHLELGDVHIYPGDSNEINVFIEYISTDNINVQSDFQREDFEISIKQDNLKTDKLKKYELPGLAADFKKKVMLFTKGGSDRYYISQSCDDEIYYEVSIEGKLNVISRLKDLNLTMSGDIDAEDVVISYHSEEEKKFKPYRYRIMNGNKKDWRIVFLNPADYPEKKGDIFHGDKKGRKRAEKMTPHLERGIAFLTERGFANVGNNRFILLKDNYYDHAMILLTRSYDTIPVIWVSSVILKVFGFDSGETAAYISLINAVSNEFKDRKDIPYFIQSGIQVIVLDKLFETIFQKRNKFMKFKENKKLLKRVFDLREWGPPPPGYDGSDPDPERDAYFWSSTTFWEMLIEKRGEEWFWDFSQKILRGEGDPYELLDLTDEDYIIEYSDIGPFQEEMDEK